MDNTQLRMIRSFWIEFMQKYRSIYIKDYLNVTSNLTKPEHFFNGRFLPCIHSD